MKDLVTLAAGIVIAVATSFHAYGQFGPRQPDFISPEVSAEKSVKFRVYAPDAENVRLSGSDFPSAGAGVEMTKADNGVWEAIVGPVAVGAYRYVFNVDGVSVVDPRNGTTSESNGNVWSLVYVPGSEVSDTKDVPHGAVAEATYYSQSLKRFRRMHIYTPPGYENGEGTFPVFYLLHGALDCDDSWSTVGRAGFILDNLIEAGKAKPMIVVMPAGHTGPFQFGVSDPSIFPRQMEEFANDFTTDVRPHVEKNYRVKSDRGSRAIAGLSMGGSQTLNVAFAKLEDYAYVGVFSSGVFGIAGGFGGAGPSTAWEDSHVATLDHAELRKDLRLVWFGCGKDDFLLSTAKATVSMLEKHDIKVIYRETEGGHTWVNWRDYLAEFAPLLFQE